MKKIWILLTCLALLPAVALGEENHLEEMARSALKNTFQFTQEEAERFHITIEQGENANQRIITVEGMGENENFSS